VVHVNSVSPLLSDVGDFEPISDIDQARRPPIRAFDIGEQAFQHPDGAAAVMASP
jgi:hypothetical protein